MDIAKITLPKTPTEYMTLRRYLGLTQQKLAFKLSMATSSISRIEQLKHLNPAHAWALYGVARQFHDAHTEESTKIVLADHPEPVVMDRDLAIIMGLAKDGT